LHLSEVHRSNTTATPQQHHSMTFLRGVGSAHAIQLSFVLLVPELGTWLRTGCVPWSTQTSSFDFVDCGLFFTVIGIFSARACVGGHFTSHCSLVRALFELGSASSLTELGAASSLTEDRFFAQISPWSPDEASFCAAMGLVDSPFISQRDA